MKKLIKFIIFCLFSLVSATPDGELFLQGNAAFHQGKFQEAIEKWQAIEYKNSVVWHNLGNSLYNEKKILKAFFRVLR